MDPIKIGNFIKQLRTERNMSQEDLAKFLFIDRSVISKWESGKRIPDIKYIAEMCKEFNVSLDEFVYGERNTQENQVEVKKNFLDYFVSQNAKYRRIKITSLFLGVALVLIGISFLIYYFSQTYDTTKVYKLYGNSDSYIISDGLLFTTREKAYMKIGDILQINNLNNHIDNVTIYYLENNKEKIIYEGSPDKILVDFYGYNSVINVKNVDELKDKLYVKINNEDIKLSFKSNFENDNLLFDDKDDATIDENNDSNDNIPIKIKNEFNFENDMYILEIDNLTLKYIPDFETFYIENTNENLSIKYSNISKNFIYTSDNNYFSVDIDKNVECFSDSCQNELDLYNEYYNKYIKEYLEE